MPTNAEANFPDTMLGSSSTMDLRTGYVNPMSRMSGPIYARVTKVNWYNRTISCVGLHNQAGAGPWEDVPVLSPAMSQAEGLNWMPTIEEPNPEMASNAGKLEGVQDAMAVLDFISGDTLKPVCVGFIIPGFNEMCFNEPGTRIDRHVSNIYSRTTSTGTFEFAFPDGMYIKVSPENEGYDLTNISAKNANYQDRPWFIKQDSPRIAVISHPSGTKFTIDSKGALTIHVADRLVIDAPSGNLTINGIDLANHRHNFKDNNNATSHTNGPENPT